MSETIFALSSGRLPSAIAVVRVSGPQALAVLAALTGSVGAPRKARLATLRDPRSGEALDRAIVLAMPGPQNATGEDIAELHLHGGPAVVADVLAALGAIDGLRPAAPGEFTRRAFANGVLDLAAVEGLGDLIAAETSAQRKQALAQATGALGAKVAGWRRELIEVTALVEASIDFTDEADVPADLRAPIAERLGALRRELAAALDGARRGERLRDGFTVVIAGPPNAGKSSLLNTLAQRPVAIVSPVAGTTRDALETHLDLEGLPVTLIDTAGLRAEVGADPGGIEAEGIRRAREKIAGADLMLWLSDPGAPEAAPEGAAADSATEVWVIGTKRDLGGTHPAKRSLKHWISVINGEGIEALLGDLAAAARGAIGGEPAAIVRERQAHAVRDALAALDAALARADGTPELVAEDLRQAGRALGRVVGAVDVEDVLEAIFRQFCIGK